MLKTILFALFPYLICAQSYHFSQGARAASIGGCGVIVRESAAIFNNSAGLTSLKSPVVVATMRNSFLLAELKAASIGVAFPIKSGIFAARFDSHGFSSYNEQLYSLMYARQLSTKVSISADAGYFRLNVFQYASRHTFSTKVGFMLQLLSDIRFGVQVENPFSIATNDKIILPVIGRVGVAYHPSHAVMVAVEVEKIAHLPAYTKVGMEYTLSNKLIARLGIQANGNTPSFTFGVGYNLWKNTNLSAGFAQHSVLGTTSVADISWE